jgi:hypothetical protein
MLFTPVPMLLCLLSIGIATLIGSNWFWHLFRDSTIIPNYITVVYFRILDTHFSTNV